MQSVLVLWRSAVGIKSVVEAWDVLQCSKPVPKCTHHLSIKVTCNSFGCAVSVVCYQKVVANRTSLLTVYLPQLLYNALKLQVRMKFSVVTEVSTFLVITQVSSGLKKNCIFSSLANISTFMLRQLVQPMHVKSFVTVGPMFGPSQSQWITSRAQPYNWKYFSTTVLCRSVFTVTFVSSVPKASCTL